MQPDTSNAPTVVVTPNYLRSWLIVLIRRLDYPQNAEYRKTRESDTEVDGQRNTNCPRVNGRHSAAAGVAAADAASLILKASLAQRRRGARDQLSCRRRDGCNSQLHLQTMYSGHADQFHWCSCCKVSSTGCGYYAGLLEADAARTYEIPCR